MASLFDKPIKANPDLQDKIAIKSISGQILNIYVGALMSQLFNTELLGEQCLSYPIRTVEDCETGVVTELPIQIVDALLVMETAICNLLSQGAIPKTYSIKNLGTDSQAQVYKDMTVTDLGLTIAFNERTFKSNTIAITQDGEHIYFETSIIELQDFIVDTRFSGVTYEEKGSYAKPFKNLDNAILAYIGTGTRLTPQFGGSRILCTGGQQHDFTENLSINNLILEIEKGTTIVYSGADIYPIDFRTLQASSGGYSTQDRNISITLQGNGNLITDNLFAYVVNSGHTSVSPTKFRNTLNIKGLNIFSIYKYNDFESGITKTDSSPWVNAGRPTKFYFGTINEPMLVSEGSSLVSAIEDNDNGANINAESAMFTSLSQNVIRITNGFVVLKDTTLTNNYNDGAVSFVIADDSERVGMVLPEDPTSTSNLKNYKPNLCLIDIYGLGEAVIEQSTMSVGFDITYSHAWYKMNSDNCSLTLTDSNTTGVKGGIYAKHFIDAITYHPSINSTDTTLKRNINITGKLINSTVNPFTKAVMSNNDMLPQLPSNIDLTRGNIATVTNSFAGKIKESLQIFQSRADAVTNGLTSGNIFINRTTVTQANFVIGTEYQILALGTGVNWVAIGASSATIGVNFEYNGVALVGSGGTAYAYKRDIVL